MDHPPGDPGDSDDAVDADAAADASLAALADELREVARHDGAVQAQRLRLVARLVGAAAAAARRQVAARPRVSGQPDDTQVIDSAVTGEVAAVLGITDGQAGWLIDLALRLTRKLPDTLTALEQGRLDLPGPGAVRGHRDVHRPGGPPGAGHRAAGRRRRPLGRPRRRGAGGPGWSGPW